MMKTANDDRVPTGLQGLADLAGRRRLMVALNGAVYVALLFWLWSILAPGGWSIAKAVLFGSFAIAAPWSVLGVCNALIGLWLLHLCRDGLHRVAPYWRAGNGAAPLKSRTSLLLTIRNEDPARAFARLRAMEISLAATGEQAHFDFYVLSDTDDAAVAAAEELAFARWRQDSGPHAWRHHYRRRSDNRGYKAGNVRDFCDRFGAAYDFMIPLDADSLMDGETLVRFVRIGEAHPRIGILQSLVVGAPSRSAFARVFQFGMRAGMRTYTMGAAWWSADCGPFWGHNALVRVDAFTRHCELPQLAGDRHILSHDQIEAVLMRRAGYEVRVLPIECGSYEENPPTILEFMRRDERWCQGNMQYFRLVGLPGLLPMSRFQLVWAISMFIGVPAWTAIIALSGLIAATGGPGPGFPAASAAGLYLLFLAFYLAPKLAGFVDVVLTPGGVARYGGAGRFVAGSLLEIAASFFIGAAVTLRTSLFLAGLALGRTIGWGGQSRDAHGLPWRTALGVLWPQTLFGLLLYGVGLALAPGLLLWSLPLTLGYLLAAPFAWASALPTLGELFAASGLCALPEEFAEPALLVDVRRAGQTIVAPVGVPPARELEPVLD